MCGINRRVAIAEAVPNIIRGIMLQHRGQLRLEVWREVCMQIMRKMPQGVAGFTSRSSSSSSSQQAQHAQCIDGVEECPWGELQMVAMETVTLVLSTMHETYCQCISTRGGECAAESGDAVPMSLGGLRAHAQRVNVTVALSAHMMMIDAPAVYRKMTGTRSQAIRDVPKACYSRANVSDELPVIGCCPLASVY